MYDEGMSRRSKSTRTRPLALAYVRVSTAVQVAEGASLDAQRVTLTAEAQHRGWDVEIVADEGLSGKNVNQRPGLMAALDRLDRGEADALLSTRLDRVTRSVLDFASIQARAKRHHWRITLLSPNLDTEDPAGKFAVHVIAAAAEFERDLISARTREGMAQRRAEGVHVGRPRELPAEVLDRITTDRAAGLSYGRIADALTDEGVSTAHGGARWYASTVRAVLQSLTPVA